jgi:aspartyl-tRNA(Asn)/glutamyl-tRNA(Gln) amidotransferase subunit B
VDVNRSGVPLMEIVSEPDLHSVEDVRAYCLKLRQILRYLSVSSGDMEKGAMRFEANISLRPAGTTELSETRVEVKNLNSFRAVLHAVEYEIARQAKILDAGGRVEQETMGWDEARNVTVSQRSKEEAHDYRYFPEPDLPRLQIARAWVEAIRAQLPELPDEKIARFEKVFGLSAYDAGVLAAERNVADYFERAVVEGKARGVEPKALSNWITSELFALMKDANAEIDAVMIAPARLADLAALVQTGTISSTIGKKVLGAMFTTGRDPRQIVVEQNLAQVSDRGAIEAIVVQVLAANESAVREYLGGKEQTLKFLVGQVMRASQGKANPARVNEILIEKLERMK